MTFILSRETVFHLIEATFLVMAHTALNDEEIKEYFDTAGM